MSKEFPDKYWKDVDARNRYNVDAAQESRVEPGLPADFVDPARTVNKDAFNDPRPQGLGVDKPLPETSPEGN